MKWGEFSSDVQFILQRSDKQQLPVTQSQNPQIARQQQKNTNNIDEFVAHKEEKDKNDNSEQIM